MQECEPAHPAVPRVCWHCGPGQCALQLLFLLGQLDFELIDLRLELSDLVLQVGCFTVQFPLGLFQFLSRFLLLL